MDMVPNFRPTLTHDQALAMVEGKTIPNCLLGVRGFFDEYYGLDGNDRGFYDDAIFLITDNLVVGFNANCDPDKYVDATASLDLGLWVYKTGIHGLNKPQDKQYEALVQAKPVTVHRANGVTETGWFGINIHRGGMYSTGSLGCQTIYPSQWDEFMSCVKSAIQLNKNSIIPYYLIDIKSNPIKAA